MRVLLPPAAPVFAPAPPTPVSGTVGVASATFTFGTSGGTGALTVSLVSSSDTSVVPVANVTVTDTSIFVRPAAVGQSVLTIRVVDTLGASSMFEITFDAVGSFSASFVSDAFRERSLKFGGFVICVRDGFLCLCIRVRVHSFVCSLIR